MYICSTLTNKSQIAVSSFNKQRIYANKNVFYYGISLHDYDIMYSGKGIIFANDHAECVGIPALHQCCGDESGQRTKAHHHKLVSAFEPDDISIAIVFLYKLLNSHLGMSDMI